MASKFSEWKVDPFFSAAEEVQDSADRLESAYRAWINAKFTASGNEDVGIEFCRRELRTALGTSKWQLEEFETAVSRLTWDNADNDSSERHTQFISAIRSQIFVIEEALQTSNDMRDLKALPGVTLEHEEKDDFALFLSGPVSVGNHAEGDNGKGFAEENTEYSSGSLGSFESKSGQSKSSGSSSSSYALSRALEPNLYSQAIVVEEPGKHSSDIHQREGHLVVNGSMEHLMNASMRSTDTWIDHRTVSKNANAISDEHVLDVVGVYDEQQMQICSGRWELWPCMKSNGQQLRMSKSGYKRWKDGDSDSKTCTNFSSYCTRMRGRWNIEQVRIWLRRMDALLVSCIAKGSQSNWNRLFSMVQHTLSHEGSIKRACGILIVLGLIGLLSLYVTSSHA